MTVHGRSAWHQGTPARGFWPLVAGRRWCCGCLEELTQLRVSWTRSSVAGRAHHCAPCMPSAGREASCLPHAEHALHGCCRPRRVEGGKAKPVKASYALRLPRLRGFTCFSVDALHAAWLIKYPWLARGAPEARAPCPAAAPGGGSSCDVHTSRTSRALCCSHQRCTCNR